MADLESIFSSGSSIKNTGSSTCESSSSTNCSNDYKIPQNICNEENYRNENYEIDRVYMQPSKKQKCNDSKPQNSVEFQNKAKEYSDEGSLYESDETSEKGIKSTNPLFEKGFPEETKIINSQKKRTAKEVEKDGAMSTNYEMTEMLMLDKKCHHFDDLPAGWVEGEHYSGMPVYLHKATRVCTFSRPYFLGPGSFRKHFIPISAIPCLKYLQDLEFIEKEKQQQEAKNKEKVEENNVTAKERDELADASPTPSNSSVNSLASKEVEIESAENMCEIFANSKVEAVSRAENCSSIDHETLREYCSKRFKFKKVQKYKFPTFQARRQFRKSQPQLPVPEETKLISLVKTNDEVIAGTTKKDWVFNPKGKTTLTILHDYVQHFLKVFPRYEFEVLDNPEQPYSSTIYINDVKYYTGYGTSKKAAKLECANATLKILIPDWDAKLQEDNANPPDVEDLSLFDDIGIEDPAINDWCVKLNSSPPHDVLLKCIKDYFGLKQNHIQSKSVFDGYKQEFLMKVKEYVVQVPCKSKREGKILASQALLQKMNPDIHSWGSLLKHLRSNEAAAEDEVKDEPYTDPRHWYADRMPKFKFNAENSKYFKVKKPTNENAGSSNLPKSQNVGRSRGQTSEKAGRSNLPKSQNVGRSRDQTSEKADRSRYR